MTPDSEARKMPLEPPCRNGLPTPLRQLAGPPARALGPRLLPRTLNRVLARQLAEGRLAFLAGRTLAIEVTDLAAGWRFTLSADGARIAETGAPPDAIIRGDSAVLLMLAARRTDPDTLFFERRLAIEGDTALGLEAKNLLDTLEPDDLPPPLAYLIDRAGRLAEALSG